MAEPPRPQPFLIRDCALAALATGRRAQNLRELRDQLRDVDADSIYYHFWAGLLRPHFDDPEYNNDFASWARHALHDENLAERLGIIDPSAYPDMEALRAELLEVIEEQLDRSEAPGWSRREDQFHFVRAQVVVFDTGRRVARPEEFAGVLPTLSVGSIYYHAIDARRREPQLIDDFRAWLRGHGEAYAELDARLAAVDPYFTSLVELRERLTAVFTTWFAEAHG